MFEERYIAKNLIAQAHYMTVHHHVSWIMDLWISLMAFIFGT